MIKTFRGLIADGGQDTIVLHTNNGSVGYRVVKFQVVTYEPMNVTSKSVVKIYSIEQTLPATATIDFNDNTLLGMGLFSCDVNAYLYSGKIHPLRYMPYSSHRIGLFITK